MWWRWALIVLCGVSILACFISTMYDWIKGKTGPLGPHPENWWGCGIFTLILLAVAWWLGRGLMR